MRDRTAKIDMALLIGAAVIAFLAYLPALEGGFLNWDDELYVSRNPRIRSFDLGFVLWAMTSTEVANWHPLTWISYAIDYRLFGPGPFGFHLTNVILHSVNTSTAFLLAMRLAGLAWSGAPLWKARLAASAAALFFALHPLHVESVAWVSERKDLLYALFYMAGLIFYLKYRAQGKKAFYVAALAAFALSIMSKPMAMTFPVILLVLDWYPLKRLSWSRAGLGAVLEKAPFFAVSLTSGLMAMLAQGKVGALVSLDSAPFYMRALVSIRGYAFYLLKLVFPAGLAPYYPYPDDIRLLNPEFAASVAAVALVTLLCLALRRHRAFLAIWAFFVVSLAPVIGMVQVGTQAAADRYMYLPILGFCVLLGALLATLAERLLEARRRNAYLLCASGGAAVAVLAVLTVLTVRQQPVWKDPFAFWDHELAIYPAFTQGYLFKGAALQAEGRYDEALAEVSKAVAIDPGYVKAYSEMGIIYGKLGRNVDSIAWLGKAIEMDPSSDKSYNNRGYSYYRSGEYEKAIEDFKTAVALNPLNGGAYYNLALAYSKTGDNIMVDQSLRKAQASGGRPETVMD